MILNLGNRRKRDFDDLAVGAFHLYAGSGECLGRFHAANDTPDSLAVNRDNLNIAFAVQRLQGCECFGHFHVWFPPKFAALDR
jgi:hypothetical protein